MSVIDIQISWELSCAYTGSLPLPSNSSILLKLVLSLFLEKRLLYLFVSYGHLHLEFDCASKFGIFVKLYLTYILKLVPSFYFMHPRFLPISQRLSLSLRFYFIFCFFILFFCYFDLYSFSPCIILLLPFSFYLYKLPCIIFVAGLVPYNITIIPLTWSSKVW